MGNELNFLKRLREVLKHSKKSSMMLDERIKLLEDKIPPTKESKK